MPGSGHARPAAYTVDQLTTVARWAAKTAGVGTASCEKEHRVRRLVKGHLQGLVKARARACPCTPPENHLASRTRAGSGAHLRHANHRGNSTADDVDLTNRVVVEVGHEETGPEGRCQVANLAIHDEDDSEVYRVDAHLLDDRQENRREDEDLGERVQPHPHEGEEEADQDENEKRRFRYARDEAGDHLRHLMNRDQLAEGERGAPDDGDGAGDDGRGLEALEGSRPVELLVNERSHEIPVKDGDDGALGGKLPNYELSSDLLATNWKVAPELAGVTAWFNSEPFTIQEQLDKGNVVLIDFWTYTCINCLRTMPYLKEWHMA